MNNVLLSAGLVLVGVAAFSTSALADGKASFEAAGCPKCHAVEAWGVKAEKADKGPDLSKIEDLTSAAEIVSFVSKKSEKKAIFGAKKGEMVQHKKKFDKPELQEIAEALAALAVTK